MAWTKEDQLAYQRRKRKETGNLYTKKYEKSERGFLMRLYRNMKSRIVGVQKIKHHLYQGKDLLDKKDFYAWAISSEQFKALFKAWTDSGFDRKLSPSVDRINPGLGYTLDNMEWVTHSENSRRGAESKNQTHGYGPYS